MARNQRIIGVLAAAAAMIVSATAYGQALNEDLIRFNPRTAEVKQIGGTWKVVTDGDHWLLDFGTSEESAHKAAGVITHYGMDCVGYVGRPNAPMEYYLVGGASPAGPCEGEDALAFNPANIEARFIQNHWKVVDGDHWMLDFGDKKQDAEKAVRVIKKYGFTYICFVGRSAAARPMMYFRKDKAASDKPTHAKPAEPKPTELAAPAAGSRAKLRVTVFEGKDSLARNPAVSLHPASKPDEAIETRTENPAVFEVEAGTYSVTAKVGMGEPTAPREVVLQAAQTEDVTIRTATGTIEVTLTAGGQPISPCPIIELRAGGRLINAASESPARFQVAEGVYGLRVNVNASQQFEAGDVAVAAGETTAKTVEAPIGRLSVRVAGGPYGQGGKLPYVEVDAGGRLVAALVDSPAKFQLLAGPYDVCILEDAAKRGAQSVTVEPGRLQEVTLSVQTP